MSPRTPRLQRLFLGRSAAAMLGRSAAAMLGRSAAGQAELEVR